MFTQVDESLSQSQGGLGIGLTLVKRLVELHGGRVEASSEGLGKGTQFTARLPIAQAEVVRPPPASQSRRNAHTIARRVLVADDNRDAAESMGMLLRLMGNEVRTVHDGVQAVNEAEDVPARRDPARYRHAAFRTVMMRPAAFASSAGATAPCWSR